MVMIAIIFAKKRTRFEKKHSAMLCNETMINRISRILYESSFFTEIILYTKDSDLNSKYAETVIDASEGILINSILECVGKYHEFLAIGGDMPLIDYTLLKKIIEKYNKKPVTFKNSETYEPLFTLYKMKIYNELKEYVDNGYKSINKFIEKNDFDIILENKGDERKLKSVNYFSDLINIRNFLKC